MMSYKIFSESYHDFNFLALKLMLLNMIYCFIDKNILLLIHSPSLIWNKFVWMSLCTYVSVSTGYIPRGELLGKKAEVLFYRNVK